LHFPHQNLQKSSESHWMPLITCPDCNKEVSDKAEACIHCGCPIKETLEVNSIGDNVTSESGRKGTLIHHSQNGGGRIKDEETGEIISFSPYEVSDKKLLSGYLAKTLKYEKVAGRLKIHAPSDAPINPFLTQNSRNSAQYTPAENPTHVKHQYDEMPNFFSKTGLIVLLFLFVVFSTKQYFNIRWKIQETAEKILTDNGYSGFTADGINLPISAVLSGNATANIFFKDNMGNIKKTQWQITNKGIPIIMAFVGTDYLVETSGLELMKLSQ
jgi:hypothetical protein